MKLNEKQYLGIINSYANEAAGSMEKKAEGNALGNFILGKRDLSNESDQKTKFWKDRIGGILPASAVSYAVEKPIRRSLESNVNKMVEGIFTGTGGMSAYRKVPALTMARSVLPLSAVIGVNYGRGKNLAKSNDTTFSGWDVAKSTIIPFISPDSIVKKKLRNRPAQEIVEKAAELLVDAVICKEACYQNAENAELYAEASEVALNNLGYNL